jgi:hypothetical protein
MSYHILESIYMNMTLSIGSTNSYLWQAETVRVNLPEHDVIAALHPPEQLSEHATNTGITKLNIEITKLQLLHQLTRTCPDILHILPMRAFANLDMLL